MKHLNQNILSLLVALLATGCATSTPMTEEGEPKDRARAEALQASQDLAKELRDELEIGRQMAAKLAGSVGKAEVESSELLRYVNLVGTNIARRSNRPEIKFRFGILNNREPNAFAAPGGFVFLTTGLLRQIQTESELAGVLAHEIAHVSEKHMYKTIMPKREISAGETLTRALSRGGSELGYSLSQAVNAGMDLLLDKGLGKEKEFEADSIGVFLASAAGYHPAGLRDLLKRTTGKDAGHALNSKTHPPSQERLAALDDFMAKNGLGSVPQKGDLAVLKERFQRALASLPADTE